MDEGCKNIQLLSLLWLVFIGASGELADPVLKKTGQDAVLGWHFPVFDEEKEVIFSVSLHLSNQTKALFFGITKRDSQISIEGAYQGRLDVLDSLNTGVVTFVLKNVTAADAGLYVCTSSFGETLADIIPDCGQMLVIVGKPQNTTVLHTTAAVEGHDLWLECVATSTSLPHYHNLSMSVQWFDSAGESITSIQEKVELHGTKLLVRSIHRQDKGLRFSCRASDGLDDWSERSPPYILEPEYGPQKEDIDMSPAQEVVRQGMPLQRQCSASCNPACTVTWQKQHWMGHWNRLETQGSSLSFSNIQRDEAGRYLCVAENKHGTENRSLVVDVQYAPNIRTVYINEEKRGKIRANEGVNVMVKCEFDSHPAPIVRWFRYNEENNILAQSSLTDQEPVVTMDSALRIAAYTSEFHFPSVLCSDTGSYMCSASNDIGSGTEGSFHLDIVCMPRNTHGEMSLKQLYLSFINQVFSVDFQVEAYPPADIKSVTSENDQGFRRFEEKGTSWSIQVSTVQSHPFLTSFAFSLPRPTADYFDRTYYLDIGNSEGTTVLAFLLRQRGAPRPPRNLTAVWIDDSSMHLFWKPGFHGGEPQTFIVEYQDNMQENKSSGIWKTIPATFQETLDESPKEITVDGLRAGSSYHVHVIAVNKYGNSTSTVLTIITLAAAAASSSGGAVAGAVIAVLVLAIVVSLVLVYIFVIRKRRRKSKSSEDATQEPMLGRNGKKTEDSPVAVADKPEHASPSSFANNSNNAPRMGNPYSKNPGNEKKNQDGLIYADLELPESKKWEPKESNDSVHYDSIDFTRKPPQPNPDNIELASDEEELPSKK